MITKEEVIRIQNKWSNGLLDIVNRHQNNDDYLRCASNFIDDLYDYVSGEVLFKPTLVSSIQFRKTKEGALSYFVGRNDKFLEDTGFVLRNWTKIRWENYNIRTFKNFAFAMGNYYFTNHDGELKVEFSFVYRKDINNNLRIILHDSHLPYQK